jgi:exonuclease III
MVNSYTSHIGEEPVLQSNLTSFFNNNCNLKPYFRASYQNSEGRTYKCITNQIKQHFRPHTYSLTNFKIFHQNVRGITHKTEELLISLSQVNPQVLCLTEHHLRHEEISIINLGQYTLGAHYCRRNFKQGRVFINNKILFDVIDLKQFNKEKDFEICALKIQLMSTYLIVLCVYRSPSGNFPCFLTQLEIVLNKLYKISTNIILCGDFNVNFLNITSRAPLLESLLHSFCLESTVDFLTRNMHTSHTIIDNIFLGKKRFNLKVHPLINGISDHDAHLAILFNLTCPSKPPPICSRVIDDYSAKKFVELLSYESWEAVFSNDNINIIFNSFSDTYLRIFQSCFPIKKKPIFSNFKPWLTHGTKISCANKKKF